MKNNCLKSAICFFTLSLLLYSCYKPVEPDDKNKIDIKGTLMNGDMKNPNIVAKYEEKTLWVTFYDDLGECVVSVSNPQDSIVFCDTVTTSYYASTRFFMVTPIAFNFESLRCRASSWTAAPKQPKS